MHGWSKQLDERAAKYDVEAAKKLLADAGYPQGFTLKLDCPNDRYVNDEAICAGRHSDVDAHRRQDQSADRADGAVRLARDEQRRQRLPVRLGRGHV